MRDPRQLLAKAPAEDPVRGMGRPPVPITLLTGFLGAGKTTLLNHILGGDHGLRLGVLVNDFGAISIDAALVECVEENTISLTNGCICCEIRDDLVASIGEILTRTEAIDGVLVEASGVADPAGIVMTLLDRRFNQLVFLDSIVCVMDAEAVFSQGDDDQLNLLKLRQIAFADLVVLNKVDAVGPRHIEVVKDWIGLHLNRIRVIEATYGVVPLELLLGVGRFELARLPEATRGALHDEQPAGASFDRWSYSTEALFSRVALDRMVKRELPASVYRCKGIIFTEDEPDQPFVVQVVGRRTQISRLARPGPRAKRSEIVAIGRGLDEKLLHELFAGCHS